MITCNSLRLLIFILSLTTKFLPAAVAADGFKISGQVLESALKNHEVDRFEILYFPVRIESFSGLSPANLDARFIYKTVVRNECIHFYDDVGDNLGKRDPDYVHKLISITKEIIVSDTDGNADFRWAVIFYKKDNTRVFDCYTNQFGNIIVSNGSRLKPEGLEIINWFNANFLSGFQALSRDK